MVLTQSRVSWLTLSLHVAPNGLHRPGTQGREGTLALVLPSGAHFQPERFSPIRGAIITLAEAASMKTGIISPPQMERMMRWWWGEGEICLASLSWCLACVYHQQKHLRDVCAFVLWRAYFFSLLTPLHQKMKLEAIATQRRSSAYQFSQGWKQQMQ